MATINNKIVKKTPCIETLLELFTTGSKQQHIPSCLSVQKLEAASILSSNYLNYHLDKMH